MGYLDQKMAAVGRMPKHFGSRDYGFEDVINCAALQCPVNRKGKCFVPSAIQIGADFRCKTGLGLMDGKKPERPIEGD